MTSESIADLILSGRVENVPVDRETARSVLFEAARHTESAAAIAPTDSNGAYQLLYDAARKAVSAHMLAHGLRARNRQGAHQAVVLYAEEALAACEHVQHLDRMRRSRNRSEYDVKVFGVAEVAADLAHARGVLAAVKEELG
jgi:hypothetical protein